MRRGIKCRFRTHFIFDGTSQLPQSTFFKLFENWSSSQQQPLRINPTDIWNNFKQTYSGAREENGVLLGIKYQTAPTTTTAASSTQSTPTSTPIPPKIPSTSSDGPAHHPNGVVDLTAGGASAGNIEDTEMADAGLEFLDLAGEGTSSSSMKVASLTSPGSNEKSSSDAAPTSSNSTSLQCWWGRANSNKPASTPATVHSQQDPACDGPFDSDAQILQHVLTRHIQSDSSSPLLTCQWKSCDYVCPTDDKRQLFAHVKTHTPFSTSHGSGSKLTSLLAPNPPSMPLVPQNVIAQLSNHYATTQEKEMKYVPLTTLYILRNMARAGIDLAAIEPDLIKWADASHFVGSSPGLLYESLRNI